MHTLFRTEICRPLISMYQVTAQTGKPTTRTRIRAQFQPILPTADGSTYRSSWWLPILWGSLRWPDLRSLLLGLWLGFRFFGNSPTQKALRGLLSAPTPIDSVASRPSNKRPTNAKDAWSVLWCGAERDGAKGITALIEGQQRALEFWHEF